MNYVVQNSPINVQQGEKSEQSGKNEFNYLKSLGLSNVSIQKITSDLGNKSLDELSGLNGSVVRDYLIKQIKMVNFDNTNAVFLTGPSFSDLLQAIKAVAHYYGNVLHIKPTICALHLDTEHLLVLKSLARRWQISIQYKLADMDLLGQIIIGDMSIKPSYAKLINVLPAIWQTQNLIKAQQDFPEADLILTQFDQVFSLGAVFDLLLQTRANLLAITNPDLNLWNAEQLLSKAESLCYA